MTRLDWRAWLPVASLALAVTCGVMYVVGDLGAPWLVLAAGYLGTTIYLTTEGGDNT